MSLCRNSSSTEIEIKINQFLDHLKIYDLDIYIVIGKKNVFLFKKFGLIINVFRRQNRTKSNHLQNASTF